MNYIAGPSVIRRSIHDGRGWFESQRRDGTAEVEVTGM